MRVNLGSLLFGLVVTCPACAFAQPELPFIYTNAAYGFQTVFPGEPEMREVTYATIDGTDVAARQFYVEIGVNEYHVTVVDMPDGPAVDFDAFDHAVEQARANGEPVSDYEVSYDPGVPGWQLSLLQPDGQQRRATIYMWAHKLIIAEAVTVPGDLASLRFDQSLILLNADGTEVDTGSGSGNVAVERPE